MFGSERDRLPLFSHIVVCLLSLTRVRLCRINIRHIRTCVLKMQTPDMLKIPESGLIHFLLYWLRYKNKNGCVIYYLRTASKTEVGKTVPENTCSAPTNMICYRQSRNILLNRIGHGAFDYSLRFSHFYGDAILNYLLEFFFA